MYWMPLPLIPHTGYLVHLYPIIMFQCMCGNLHDMLLCQTNLRQIFLVLLSNCYKRNIHKMWIHFVNRSIARWLARPCLRHHYTCKPFIICESTDNVQQIWDELFRQGNNKNHLEGKQWLRLIKFSAIDQKPLFPLTLIKLGYFSTCLY